ncbi:hypothetical protein QTP70_021247 [Hemibagrus guttatus]|uniref:Uncharacterized protein n=1 Tax=Hemibagrus guttatus TaxID=175788 RepID=A0AAE0RAJ4_9TELE|nr:hypothetical protein QTP70_021247 [Hemibagrus guttatus]KAK3570607.1 hypothetical protein QTP86_023660 [Hemibagrus guttatus]
MNNRPLEFFVPGNSEGYLDLNNTFLHLAIHTHSVLPLNVFSTLGKTLWKDNCALDYSTKTYGCHCSTFDQIGHNHSDIFFQDKFLLNGIDLRIKMIHNKDEFCLREGNANLVLKILDISPVVKLCKNTILLTSGKTWSCARATYSQHQVSLQKSVHEEFQPSCEESHLLTRVFSSGCYLKPLSLESKTMKPSVIHTIKTLLILIKWILEN